MVLPVMVFMGCSTVSYDLPSAAEKEMVRRSAYTASRPSYDHVYYSYYLQPDVGRISSDISSNVFSYRGMKFSMNLDIPAIINGIYYPDTEQVLYDDAPVCEYSGSYSGADGAEHAYTLRMYQSGGSVLTELRDDQVIMNAVTDPRDAPYVAGEMLEVMMSVVVKKDLVLEAFSNRELIYNTRKKLDLFEDISPESGVIDELLIKDDEFGPEQDGGRNGDGDD